MGRITIKKGDAFYFDRTFTEKDICLYAGMTDGLYPGQIRSEADQASSGTIIVPEGLLLGLMSVAASMASHTAGRMIHSIINREN